MARKQKSFIKRITTSILLARILIVTILLFWLFGIILVLIGRQQEPVYIDVLEVCGDRAYIVSLSGEQYYAQEVSSDSPQYSGQAVTFACDQTEANNLTKALNNKPARTLGSRLLLLGLVVYALFSLLIIFWWLKLEIKHRHRPKCKIYYKVKR